MEKNIVGDLMGKEEAFRKVSLLVDIWHFLQVNRENMTKEEYCAFDTVINYIGDMEVEV